MLLNQIFPLDNIITDSCPSGAILYSIDVLLRKFLGILSHKNSSPKAFLLLILTWCLVPIPGILFFRVTNKTLIHHTTMSNKKMPSSLCHFMITRMGTQGSRTNLTQQAGSVHWTVVKSIKSHGGLGFQLYLMVRGKKVYSISRLIISCVPPFWS